MMDKVKLKEGGFAVKYARLIIESHFSPVETKIPKEMEEFLESDRGSFVTLKTHIGRKLRGGSGYLAGIMPLSRSLPEVAYSAAFRDHRFNPLRRNELKTTLVEVSLTSKPESLGLDNVSGNYLRKIKIGKTGLMIRGNISKGMLLPQTALERGWGPKEYLSRVCIRAQLEPDAWKDPDVELYTFTAETFMEEEPRGKVKKLKTKKH